MGYSKAQKEKTHKRIVAIASERFREKGLAGFGIAELMKEAGHCRRVARIGSSQAPR
jgi:TetR/AcrR family transcriptional repressor of nem operon